MIKTPPELRALTSDLSVSAWTLCSIGVLFESGLAEHLGDSQSVDELVTRCPALSADRIERCLALAASVGVVVRDGMRFRLAEGAAPFLESSMRASLQGSVRSTLMQALLLLDSATTSRPERGWRHTNAALLQAQGDSSAVLPAMIKASFVPSMGDLGARLASPDARFLDVGVGVGALAIAMCRAFPAVRVVGLDCFDLPLSMARENVRRAGLSERIDLRLLAIEKLAEEDAFDLAWLPTFFIPEDVLPHATTRVRASLRTGGWILFPTGQNPAANEQQRAHFALLDDLWGGPTLSVERAESLLREAGFSAIRTIPGPAWAPAMLIAQR